MVLRWTPLSTPTFSSRQTTAESSCASIWSLQPSPPSSHCPPLALTSPCSKPSNPTPARNWRCAAVAGSCADQSAPLQRSGVYTGLYGQSRQLYHLFDKEHRGDLPRNLRVRQTCLPRGPQTRSHCLSRSPSSGSHLCHQELWLFIRCGMAHDPTG